ncbi:JNK-interacting protein 1 [Anthonomus grandis grandis]|uniref:JNK-interacting protein 1 n=1 Tax=Anthonomus grandis grandis TaxID=2921223 RepID=UPI002166498A|nr:JNK-interacting protein 1 [Anthonomus grandis grandis]
MADVEFEQFGRKFEKNCISNVNNSSPFYSLVHVDDDSPSTSPSPEEETHDCDNIKESSGSNLIPTRSQIENEDNPTIECCGARGILAPPWKGERRRRKLPEIPKNKKSAIATMYSNAHQQLSRDLSLADEMASGSVSSSGPNSILGLKCGYLWDESPESDRLLTDADSGHSTAHSPTGTDGPKSMSPLMGSSPSIVGGMMYSDVDMLESTHRALHKFVPRHEDEIELEIGDPVYVQKEADDLWCEGVNLRTGRMGIFPSAYAVDTDYSDWDSNTDHGRRERYILGYLGSVETLAHKGTSVVCQAVRRVIGNGTIEPEIQVCTLEVSDQGLRMVDRRKREQSEPCIDYFYSLKNVSFCAFHPRDHRYLGFITKHPTLQRFACHVFRGPDSTRPVAEAVGRAFQRFYQKFIETAYPVEDIYIE